MVRTDTDTAMVAELACARAVLRCRLGEEPDFFSVAECGRVLYAYADWASDHTRWAGIELQERR